jgi:DNA-directed RNA polymerase subunit M/transcription elongation factor TFIIS
VLEHLPVSNHHTWMRGEMADADTTMYICSKCKLEQPAENFHRNKRNVARGRRPQCKGCVSKSAQLVRVLRKTTPKPPKPSYPDGYKKCPRCQEVKVIESFGLDGRRPDGHKGWCKGCHTAGGRERWKNDAGLRMKVAARNREWIKRHPEKNTEYTGRWRKLNPDAAKALTQAYRARKRSAEGRYYCGRCSGHPRNAKRQVRLLQVPPRDQLRRGPHHAPLSRRFKS